MVNLFIPGSQIKETAAQFLKRITETGGLPSWAKPANRGRASMSARVAPCLNMGPLPEAAFEVPHGT
jgi:hypothetical protein